jgi:hypothetical protein
MSAVADGWDDEVTAKSEEGGGYASPNRGTLDRTFAIKMAATNSPGRR